MLVKLENKRIAKIIPETRDDAQLAHSEVDLKQRNDDDSETNWVSRGS